MKAFINYLRNYLLGQSSKSLFFTILFVATLVTVNYTFGIERRIQALHPWYAALGVFFLFYAGVLTIAWVLQLAWTRNELFNRHDAGWWWIVVAAPLYFSLKMLHWDLRPLFPAAMSPVWERYTLAVLQWPAKLLLLLVLIYTAWKAGILTPRPGYPAPANGFPGTTGLTGPNRPGTAWGAVGLVARATSFRPYLLILLMLIPLIALASTQHDFLRVYPKLKTIAFINGYVRPRWPWQVLYELCYGSDFLSVELFFRGLLVIGLARYAGTSAILPMAAFYCTIHFGKPLGECISSFFGGMVLGVLAVRTRSIVGGLMVHLGLAWLMEIGGWIGGGW